MDQTTYASRLRYLDAGDVEDAAVRFRELDVHGSDGERLGKLDGFLVEHGAGSVHYLVVDSGGWFTSRRLLIPAEQVTIDRDAKAIRTTASRTSLRGYPEFDEDRFGRFSDDEYHAYQRRLGGAWPTQASSAGATGVYRQPDWWRANAYRAERLRPIESRSFGSRSGIAAAGIATPGAAAYMAERDDGHRHGDVIHSHPGGREPHTHHEEREHVMAHDRDESRRDHDRVHDSGGKDRDDVSPHFGGRAQPGDVLGLETGGETTAIGDSAEDENKRRRTAEETNRRE